MSKKVTATLDNTTVYSNQTLKQIKKLVKQKSKKSSMPMHTLALQDQNGNMLTVVFPQMMNSSQVSEYLLKTYGSVLNFMPKQEWRSAPIVFKVQHFMGKHHVMFRPINTKKPNIVIVDADLQAIDSQVALSADSKKDNKEVDANSEIIIAPALLKFMGIDPKDMGAH